MSNWIKSAVQRALRSLYLELVSLDALRLLQERSAELNRSNKLLEREYDEYCFLRHFPAESVGGLMALRNRSHSQIGQDRFVLHELGFKRGGFFVEFGATNGIDFSNTYLLERDYGWTGILAEPAICWHEALAKNRAAKIDRRCVWSRSAENLIFKEVQEAVLSTLATFAATDMYSQARNVGRTYEVRTVSLLDLLDEYGAPHEIDYLSIDTEGSEFDILSAFDFSRYRFSVITVEHNHTPSRDRIHDLLASNGYLRKLAEASKVDDWYVYKKQ